MSVIGAIGLWTAIGGAAAMLAGFIAVTPLVVRLRARMLALQARPSFSKVKEFSAAISARAEQLGPKVSALVEGVGRLQRAIEELTAAGEALLNAVRQSAEFVERALDEKVPYLRGALHR
jgi:hypothetical protein